jgi:hypothetical protein
MILFDDHKFLVGLDLPFHQCLVGVNLVDYHCMYFIFDSALLQWSFLTINHSLDLLTFDRCAIGFLKYVAAKQGITGVQKILKLARMVSKPNMELPEQLVLSSG